MRILMVTTKLPWPPVDGGRVLMQATIDALGRAGHEVTLVAPWLPPDGPVEVVREALAHICRTDLVATTPRPWPVAWLRAAHRGGSASLTRHALPAVRERVRAVLASSPFDVVHAEQVQAVAQCAPAAEQGLPLVLRAQNVETDLWTALADRGGLRGWLAGLEARRLAIAEGAAVRGAAVTVALSAEDAGRLRRLAGERADVRHVAAPFASDLPPADANLPGAPPLVILGSGNWLPNRLAVRWFVDEIWPAVARDLPAATLHLFGHLAGHRARRDVGLHHHPAPDDSRQAFASNAILIVPVRIASGVRVKILEAWARGVPVIATPEGAAGLGAVDRQALLVASNAREFADAVTRIAGDPTLRARLVREGRDHLRRHHAPEIVAAELVHAYEEAVAARTDRA